MALSASRKTQTWTSLATNDNNNCDFAVIVCNLHVITKLLRAGNKTIVGAVGDASSFASVVEL